MMEPDQIHEEVRGRMRSSIFSAKSITKIATWNVRTLFQTGKLAQTIKEFYSYNLSLLGISEMRWTGSGKMSKSKLTILYSVHAKEHVRGVGFLLDKETSDSLIGWTPVNDRIITARFQSRHTRTTVVQIYAPTDESDDTIKDTFYDQLQDTFNNIPSHDLVILIVILTHSYHLQERVSKTL